MQKASRNHLSILLAAGIGALMAGGALATELPPGPPPPPTNPDPGGDFARGQRDGMRYGKEVGRKKGIADGQKAGDRDGYAAGLRDAEHGITNPEDPGQPPGGDPPPPIMPPADPPGDEPPPMDPPDDPPGDEPPMDPPADPPGDEPPMDPPEDPPGDASGPGDLPPPEDGPLPPEVPPSDGDLPPGTEEGGSGSGAEGDGDPEEIYLDLEMDVEAEAMSRYPDLVPRSPRASLAAKLRGALDDPEVKRGLEYSKGFALGFAAGYGQSYQLAKKRGYDAAFPRGYARGQADWRRRNTDESGNLLTPAEQLARATAEFQRGNLREAADRYDMVLARGDAGDLADDALYGLARTRYRLKQYAAARGVVDRLLETIPDSPVGADAAFLRGAAIEHEKKGGFFGIGAKPDFAAAAAAFEELVLRWPESPLLPDAYYRLGFTSERLKRWSDAAAAYQRVIESWPGHPAAARAKRRLARLPRPRRR